MESKSVFLSYAQENRDYVQALHDRLEGMQIEAWWDQECAAGHDWIEQVYTWLKAADAVVVLVSQYSVTSQWVKHEVYEAQHHRRHVIPVLLEDAEGGLWLLIRLLHRIDARDGRDPVPEIIRALCGPEEGQSRSIGGVGTTNGE